MRRCVAVFSLLGTCLFVAQFASVSAQELGVAQQVSISGPVSDSSIISQINSTYQVSSEPYDKGMIGVVTNQPAMELIALEDTPDVYALVSQGMVNVRVNGENGPIITGDAITSSSQPGVGMKAVKTGFVLGYAQADFSGEGETIIPVNLSIKFAFAADSPTSERIGSRLLDVISISGVAAISDPLTTFKYILAAVIVVGSLVVTFLTVAKVARNGVESIARNPMAKNSILTGIIINSILSIVIIGIGLVAAYMVTII